MKFLLNFSDGTDLEYWINSHAITVTVPSFKADKNNKVLIDLQMKQLRNNSGSWNVSCGLMDHSGTWNFNGCTANTFSGDDTIYCSCPKTGTVALFLTARAVRVTIVRTF